MPITQLQFAGLTLEQAHAGLMDGSYTPAELAAAAKERMDIFEPAVNAVITRNDEGARAAAAAADPARGPISGVPVAVKDNIMTRGLRSTCGSRILDTFIPPYNATAVDKIVDAGAVIPCKTNMDEFAMGASGQNSAYGASHNPWDLARITGGSSSGSAAIVAYGGAPAALASDTGGSIRQPASFCGVVGMKPTYGRVSRYGLGALASSLDQIGPITKTVRDNALLMDILSGGDPHDSTSAERVDEAAPCFPTVENGVKGLRVAYDPACLDLEGMAPAHAAALRHAVDVCRQAGAEIREVTVPLLKYGVAAYYIICSCEASANMARYDGVRYGVRSGSGDLWEVFSQTRGTGLGDEVKRRIMMGSYALSKGYYDAYYLKAARVRKLFMQEFEKLLEQVDVLLMPVSPQPPRRLDAQTTLLENYLGDIFTLPANLSSVPALAFPTGVCDGLPCGVQALAAPYRENILYQTAREVEKTVTLPNAPWTFAAPEGGK